MRVSWSAWVSVVGASFFTDIAGFLHEQAALVTAGRWLDLNGGVTLAGIVVALVLLSRGVCWIRRNFRSFGRVAVMITVFTTMITVYYGAMLAYGLFWFWIYQEIQIYFRYEQRLELAVATAGAALLVAALGFRIFWPKRTPMPAAYVRTAAAARGRR